MTQVQIPADEPINGNGFYHFTIGELRATVISDGYGEIPVGPVFAVNAPEADVASVLEANFMPPVIQGTCHMLVVDTERERILVDTGFGERIGPPIGNYPKLMGNLHCAGIRPESIDVVALSHGHLDHIGGLVTATGAVAFPNARIVFVDAEWNYWTGSRYEGEVAGSPIPEPFKTATLVAARENLPVVAERVQLVAPDGEIAAGVRYLPGPGHSPANAAIVFSAGREQFIYMGDIAHDPVIGLQRPDWTPVFDYDPGQAIVSRKTILDLVATDRALVMGCHFPFPAVGHVVRQEHAFRWEPARWVW
jgi:glyoxylase-like metal-dependent hydrolase (beta-lactamase superfamily II)